MTQPYREAIRRPVGERFGTFEVNISPRGHNNFHYHDDCELVVIRSGSGIRFVGDSIEEYRAGDVVLLGSRVPHTWCPAKGFDSGGRADVLQFDPSLVSWAELEEARQLLETAAVGLRYPEGTAHELGDRWMSSRHGLTGTQSIIAVLDALAVLIARASEAVPLCSDAFPITDYQTHRRSDATRRIDRIRDVISERFHEPLVQADVARDAGMQPAAFCRFFRAQTGRTFTQYVQELRVKQAAQLLSHTDKSVTDVATEVGFQNLSHFNRCFKRHIGTTPTRWRRDHRLGLPHPST